MHPLDLTLVGKVQKFPLNNPNPLCTKQSTQILQSPWTCAFSNFSKGRDATGTRHGHHASKGNQMTGKWCHICKKNWRHTYSSVAWLISTESHNVNWLVTQAWRLADNYMKTGSSRKTSVAISSGWLCESVLWNISCGCFALIVISNACLFINCLVVQEF